MAWMPDGIIGIEATPGSTDAASGSASLNSPTISWFRTPKPVSRVIERSGVAWPTDRPIYPPASRDGPWPAIGQGQPAVGPIPGPRLEMNCRSAVLTAVNGPECLLNAIRDEMKGAPPFGASPLNAIGLWCTSSFDMRIPVVPDCLDEFAGLRGHVDGLAVEVDQGPSEGADAIEQWRAAVLSAILPQPADLGPRKRYRIAWGTCADTSGVSVPDAR